MKHTRKFLVTILTLCLACCLFVACDDPSAPQKHSITFDVDGETYHTVQTAGNEVVTLPANPTKTGYSFVGWYFDDGEWQHPLTANSFRTEALSRDTFVYAKWTPQNFDVHVDGFDESHGKVIGQGSYLYEDTVNLTFNAKDGVIFDGWYQDDELLSEDKSYSFSMPAQSVSLTVKCYKFTVNQNLPKAGSVSAVSGVYKTGELQTVTAANANLGYTWLGWYEGDEKMSDGDSMSFAFTMPGRDLVLTAKWQVNEEIANYTFDSTQTDCKITGVIDKSLTAMSIPNYVNVIDYNAFKDCYMLESIYVPDSVITINKGAFSGCTSLRSISLPFCGRSADASNGYECFGLIFGTTNPLNNGAVVPASLKDVEIRGGNKISFRAFYGCKFIETVKLPVMTAEISSDAFYFCSSLKTVYLPASLARIGSYAFGNCENLTDIYFAGNADQWQSVQKDNRWNYEAKEHIMHYGEN